VSAIIAKYGDCPLLAPSRPDRGCGFPDLRRFEVREVGVGVAHGLQQREPAAGTACADAARMNAIGIPLPRAAALRDRVQVAGQRAELGGVGVEGDVGLARVDQRVGGALRVELRERDDVGVRSAEAGAAQHVRGVARVERSTVGSERARNVKHSANCAPRSGPEVKLR
jgi:hypothetical protein